jgi:hypothetical protein
MIQPTTDGSFRRALERQLQATRGIDEARTVEWGRVSQRLLAQVIVELRGRSSAEAPVPKALVDAWIDGHARLYSRAADAEFVRWLVEHYESLHDPRMARYWQLIAELKRMPPQTAYAEAFEWLLVSLRARLG